MNGGQHYREAEQLIGVARRSGPDDDPSIGSLLAEAQVHATLALAAATALQPRHFLTVEYRDQIAAPWIEVAG